MIKNITKNKNHAHSTCYFVYFNKRSKALSVYIAPFYLSSDNFIRSEEKKE